MPNVDNSAWIDDEFAQIDTRVTKEDLPDGSILPVEGLDNLPDADIDKLFSGVRQAKTKPATISFVDPTTNIEHDVEIGRANPDGSPAPPPQPEVESPYPKEIDPSSRHVKVCGPPSTVAMDRIPNDSTVKTKPSFSSKSLLARLMPLVRFTRWLRPRS